MFKTITYLTFLLLLISFASAARGTSDKLGAYFNRNKFTKDKQATKQYQGQLFNPVKSSINGFNEDGQLCTFDEHTVIKALAIYNGNQKGRKGKWILTYTSSTGRESRQAYALFCILISELSIYSPTPLR